MELFMDNIVFTIQKAGGVSVYWYELLKGICNSGMTVNFLNAHPSSSNLFEQRLDYQRHRCIRESVIPDKYLRYLPVRCKLPAAAVFHGGYLRVSPQKDIVNILTLHDFAHEHRLATGFPRGLANKMQKAYGIRRADGIICISHNTRKDLLHFYPDTDPAKVRVIHHGIADDFYPAAKQQSCLLRQPYILYVGGRRKYKNFLAALDTMQRLPRAYRLVAAGGERWESWEISLLESRIPGRYQLFPEVTAADLNQLYNHAFCLLYTSTYEGFGFPPGEAMKAGCPVVSTLAASIPEVVGPAGLLARTADAASFAAQIRMLENEQLRGQLIQAGFSQAALFTWEKSIAETIRFYKDCWSNKFST
ncbi:glycosyltransferase family 4 protein [Chitinophaga sp. Mgbs1]|uniref:Glycosyltransferase family 4 protein n=1 Tax=Chitinophaga solisilvae TaxID=1233460 RepID=A0A9Q5GUP5_9BACT|nr:glycosyltransferase family 4 protein [Chitinophaga solisilvae]